MIFVQDRFWGWNVSCPAKMLGCRGSWEGLPGYPATLFVLGHRGLPPNCDAPKSKSHDGHDLGMGQYLLIPFLVGWTSIYQLFWGSLGTRVLTHPHLSSFPSWKLSFLRINPAVWDTALGRFEMEPSCADLPSIWGSIWVYGGMKSFPKLWLGDCQIPW